MARKANRWRKSKTHVRGFGCVETVQEFEDGTKAHFTLLPGVYGVIAVPGDGDLKCLVFHPGTANRLIQLTGARLAKLRAGQTLTFDAPLLPEMGVDFLGLALELIRPITNVQKAAKMALAFQKAAAKPEMVRNLVPLCHLDSLKEDSDEPN